MLDIKEKLESDIFISELHLDGFIDMQTVRYLAKNRDDFVMREMMHNKDWMQMLQPDRLNTRVKKAFSDKARLAYASQTAKEMVKKGMYSVNFQDPEYPQRFAHLSGMPLILYGMGDFQLAKNAEIPSVCVVGSRSPTFYGLKVAKESVKELCRHEVCVVSGLARGIDTVSHRTAVDCKGSTIAVLAGGLDQVYPPENKDLFHRIVRQGCVLSEQPPKRKPLRQFFPSRNRILSALSDVVLVVEAGERSGTLHTASYAGDVFAVPGTIYAPVSRGCLELIRDGAEVYLSSEDLLTRLADVVFYRSMDRLDADKHRKKRLIHPEDKSADTKDKILESIRSEDKGTDALCEELDQSFQTLILHIAELELSGKIREVDGKYTYIY